MMGLPELKHDYSHAFVSSIVIGPRREATFTIQVLIWQGGRGHNSGDVQLRCGGIVNMEDVTEFSERCPTLEVAWIRYSASQKSKPGSLFLEIMSEREDDILVIHCSHITVSEVAS